MGGGGGGGVVVRELVNQWAPRVQVRIVPATFFIVIGLFSHIFLLVNLLCTTMTLLSSSLV